LKNALFVTSSANIQPTDHISTGVEYSLNYNNNSGQRYHRVTTSLVYGLIGIENALANPKSAILIVSSGIVRRTLAGFRSL